MGGTTLIISGNGSMGDGYIPWTYLVMQNFIQYVTIYEGVTSIASHAFMQGTNLKHVDIPSSVTTIGLNAFNHTGLTSIVIQSNVSSIGDGAFDNCLHLSSIQVESGNFFYVSENGILYDKEKTTLIQFPKAKSGSYIIPESVTRIERTNFSNCNKLTSITIPKSVTGPNFGGVLNNFNFIHCSSLISIDVENENLFYSSEDGVLFDKGKSTLISFPAGKSGNYMIPNDVTTIEMFAFLNCINLTSITIPSSTTNIADYAFFGCSGLTSITNLNSSPQNINTDMFTGYSGLSGIRINLSNLTLYVPAGSKSLYQAAPVWQDFGTIIELSYSPVTQPYPNIMNFTVAVSLDGDEIQSGRFEIGAFSGNECRGSAVLQSIPVTSQQSNSHGSAALQYAPAATQHSYLGFLSVYGNGDENITFKVFDHDTGKEYAAAIAPVAFAIDAKFGSPEEPFQIIIVSPTGIPNIQSGSVAVFPDSGERLIIRRPWSVIDRLEISDLNGRILWQESGFASESVNIASLAKGMYILKLVKDNRVSVYKFVKK